MLPVLTEILNFLVEKTHRNSNILNTYFITYISVTDL